ncbi:SDR family oxidoreductase [Rufibacter glacialis]|uniref:NAD(P)H-binding protein n=1 Tax=Rufibacter glacialis TaxID=1259555 RepID=A0A5M8QEW9_9BACT|nr:NAD(P)H-binding protein [Rufibacter glacialis]KAA6433296.1 NAD(P)H-binding protein [Rufibacter glacialis]GGK75671.1 3-beta hydroxysteroid dehydrogenase [Rufibacter glacialis]
METVLVLGGTGSLGASILEVLKHQPYRIRATARTALKAEQLQPSVDEVVVCDPTQPETLTPQLVQGVDYIISALGKSLRLSDPSRTSFHEVNFQGNLNVLQLALAHAPHLKKFVYVGAFSGEQHPKVAYFKAHEDFARALQASRLPATIIKPPALFSTFLDLLPMARKGKLASIGPGEGITNPIHEHEVAEACVRALTQPETTVELGGPVTYSRRELVQLIGKAAGKRTPVPQVPYWVVQSFLPVVRLVNRSLYEKAAFFVEVTKRDCVAPFRGTRTLEDYLAEHV